MPALQPAADAAPLRATWAGTLPTGRLNAEAAAAQSARVRCNLWLTTYQWAGPVERAAAVANHLVRNAVRHGSTGEHRDVFLRLSITQPGSLLIEVSDSSPQFPAFDEAFRRSGGLRRAQQLGAALSWFPTTVGKTVQARFMAPTVQS
ncbi:ATP-binding protein [Streptomyces sp. NPDC055962]|uniref:ATP-binding protein n=1 Tax=Streptomyces sp. NPDC055962 TaxID=3345667 RepID=UPI0035E224D1